VEREGVIKFELEHSDDPKVMERHRECAAAIISWRDILVRLSLVGQSAERYAGLGFGNVSARVAPFAGGRGQRAFLITGTQTGGHVCMSSQEVTLVSQTRAREGWVKSQGPVKPSSESTTHAAVYDLSPAIRWVFHVHSPLLWAWSEKHSASFPRSAADASYGSPQMADEIDRLWRETTFPESRIMAMGGHEDGVIAFGRSPMEAAQPVLTALSVANIARCLNTGALCL